CFFFRAEDGIRAFHVTGVQTCALPISDAPVPAVAPPAGASGAFPCSAPASRAALSGGHPADADPAPSAVYAAHGRHRRRSAARRHRPRRAGRVRCSPLRPADELHVRTRRARRASWRGTAGDTARTGTTDRSRALAGTGRATLAARSGEHLG